MKKGIASGKVSGTKTQHNSKELKLLDGSLNKVDFRKQSTK